MDRQTTRQAAADLGCTPDLLVSLVRRGKVSPEPQRDPHGFFVWTPADVERARVALATDLRRKPRQPA